MGMESFAQAVAVGLARSGAIDKEALHRLKRDAMAASGLVDFPTDRALAAALPVEVREKFVAVLRTKPMRSESGVAIVAVMSSPASCPHGKCVFCPGGPDVGSPQSYTGFEPSTMRAKRHNYDPYHIVRGRLQQLERNGHAIDKVDIVIQGGTFPAREMAYQDWFVAGIYAGLNDGPGEDGPTFATETEWTFLAPAEREARLAALQLTNESTRCRAIGLTIETKPDWAFEPHIDTMLRHGATRIEIGLQTLDDDVLRQTHRGHTLADSAKSMQVARDSGFKVCVHMMPGLPRQRRGGFPPVGEPDRMVPGLPRRSRKTTDSTDGTEPAFVAESVGSVQFVVEPGVGRFDPDQVADLEDMRQLFADPLWRPDMLKVYPTLVVMEGETGLKAMWQRGEYHPYDTATAAHLVAQSKSFVPEWCRIQRIDRDIPTTHVEAGVMNSNLRQLAQIERQRMGLPGCRCIRCREPAAREREGRPIDFERIRLVRREYEASGATEIFLALEDPAADAVVAFLRLRRVTRQAHRAETQVESGAAFVRELKVYGTALELGDASADAMQHRGLGASLLAEAERIAFTEWNVGRLLVIAGPGVKPYYRKHGYSDVGPYIAKDAPGRHA